MFFAGLATGAAQEITRGQERIRQRMEQQLQEAREYAKIARKRQEEADAVSQNIRNMSQSYGIDPKVLFSAYRNGHLEQYAGMIENVRQTQALQGVTATPEMLQSLYEVPASVLENPMDMDAEINRIFGVIEQGVSEVEPDDVGLGRLLLRGLGVDDGGGLERRTVGGYSVGNLMDMPLPSTPTGDGGRLSQNAYRLAATPRAEQGALNRNQIANAAGPAIVGQIRATLREAGAGSQFENLEPQILAAVTAYVEGMENPSVEAVLAAADQITEDFVFRGDDGLFWVDTGGRDPNGNRVFHQIDANGVPVPGSQRPEGQLPLPQRTPSVEEEQLPPAPSTGTPAGVEPRQPAELPPEGVPPTYNHPDYGPLTFLRVDGNEVIYLTTDGRPVRFPYEPEQ